MGASMGAEGSQETASLLAWLSSGGAGQQAIKKGYDADYAAQDHDASFAKDEMTTLLKDKQGGQ